MAKPALIGDIFIERYYHDTRIGDVSFLHGDDLGLDISLTCRSIYGGWEWQIERIGVSSYRDGKEVWTWASAEEDPVIAAAIKYTNALYPR